MTFGKRAIFTNILPDNILLVDAGKYTFDKPVQLSNKEKPIVFTLSGMDIDSKTAKLINVLLGISITLLGIVNDNKLTIELN
jgi:hypothetical protein